MIKNFKVDVINKFLTLKNIEQLNKKELQIYNELIYLLNDIDFLINTKKYLNAFKLLKISKDKFKELKIKDEEIILNVDNYLIFCSNENVKKK